MTVEQEHHLDIDGMLICPQCSEKFDLPISPCKGRKPIKLNTRQYRIAIALGFTLGMFALMIFAMGFYVKNMINLRIIDHNNYIDLVNKIEKTCGTYPNKFQTVKDGFWVECGIELKPGVEL